MERIDKVKILVYSLFRLLLLYAGITAALRGSWINVVVSSTTLFITFLPSIIERKFRVDYPGEFEILVLLFVYASVYLGDMRDFYVRFWWWDIPLHTLSGMIFGAIGFSLIYILNRSQRTCLKLTPGFMAAFAFCFALAAGSLWEIYEFLMDEFFGMALQGDGLKDNMLDMIFNTAGALLVSVPGYFYLRGSREFLKRIVKRFTRLNPRLFRKKPALFPPSAQR